MVSSIFSVLGRMSVMIEMKLLVNGEARHLHRFHRGWIISVGIHVILVENIPCRFYLDVLIQGSDPLAPPD